MWPGDRHGNGLGPKFCLHWYGAPHFVNRSNWFVSCRKCGDVVTMHFDIESGQIVEKDSRTHLESLKPGTPDQVVDKSA